jgi:hypothetical protein
MERYWGTIESSYREYVQKYPEEGMISIGDDSRLPLQSNVMANGGFVGYNEGMLEREKLITYRDDLPSISDLHVEDLALLPIELTNILKIQVTPDHDEFWKETARYLLKINSGNEPLHDELVSNFETMVRATLSTSWIGWSRHSDNWSSETNEQHVIGTAPIMARYMAFPTLEGIVKSICRDDIDMDGEIKQGRTVLNYSGDDYSGGDECNNIGHLLWHFEQEVAEDTLRNRLEDFREEFSSFYTGIKTGEEYGRLSDIRNTALHGEAEVQGEFGMLLNLLSLIVWNLD